MYLPRKGIFWKAFIITFIQITIPLYLDCNNATLSTNKFDNNILAFTLVVNR